MSIKDDIRDTYQKYDNIFQKSFFRSLEDFDIAEIRDQFKIWINTNSPIFKDMIDAEGRPLATKSYNYYAQSEYVQTIAPSTQPLDPEWVDEGAEAFTWLLKKRDKAWLEERGMLQIIEAWK